MLSSPHAVTKCCVAAGRPAFMGGLSPALYRLICTSPPCKNVTNIGVGKMSAPAKIALTLKSQPLKTTVHVKLYFFHTRLHIMPSYSTCFSHKTTSTTSQHPIRTDAKKALQRLRHKTLFALNGVLLNKYSMSSSDVDFQPFYVKQSEMNIKRPTIIFFFLLFG